MFQIVSLISISIEPNYISQNDEKGFMELPIRYLVLILLMVIALLAVLTLLNPIQSSSLTAQQMQERNIACSNWSMKDCKPTAEKELQEVEMIFGCSGAEDCKKKCSSIKFCLIW